MSQHGQYDTVIPCANCAALRVDCEQKRVIILSNDINIEQLTRQRNRVEGLLEDLLFKCDISTRTKKENPIEAANAYLRERGLLEDE